MELSSSLCRIQEKVHRDRAASAELENVRVIAEDAAAAWAGEAEAAEQREARRSVTRAHADEIQKLRLRQAQPG